MIARDFAHALADMSRERVIAAQVYMLEHQDLEQMGVPIEIARHALDRRALGTEPRLAIRAWDGKGLLALHGARDNGKTHAAALWALERRRAGRRTVWVSCAGLLSFEALDAAFGRTMRAAAVVLDDVGPGLGGTDGFRTKLAAWIQERGHSPTVLTSNANTAQLQTYLGERVISRLRQAGKLASFPREAGLREADPEPLDPDTGRGQRWLKARWMTWRFGCEPDDRLDDGRVVHGYRVGDALASAWLPLEQLHALAMRIGLDVETVERRAAEMAEESDRVSSLLATWQPPTMGAQSTTMDEIIELADADVRQAKQRAKLRGASRGIAPCQLLDAPGWATGEDGRSKLVAFGFSVAQSLEGWVVKRRLAPKAKPIVMSPVIATQPAAWAFAAQLCAEPPPPRRAP